MTGGGYVLSYQYHLGGALKSIADSFNHTISYTADKVSRTTKVGNGSVEAAFANNIEYRAFGGVKAMSLSSTYEISETFNYDNALRPSAYEAIWSKDDSHIHDAEYTYGKDGLVSAITNNADTSFNQVNKFDFASRLKFNDVGPASGTHPFQQTMSYDAFSNLTARSTTTYTFDPRSFTASYTNNRKTAGGAVQAYDVAGNVTWSHETGVSDTNWTLDVQSRPRRWEEFGPYGASVKKGQETTFDGDGRAVKVAELERDLIGGVWQDWSAQNWYYLYSSVTGEKVEDIIWDGTMVQYHVNMGSTEIATVNSYDGAVDFRLHDPVTDSMQRTDTDGAKYDGQQDDQRTEIGGLGTSVPTSEPTGGYPPPWNYKSGGWHGNPESGCGSDLGPSWCNRVGIAFWHGEYDKETGSYFEFFDFVWFGTNPAAGRASDFEARKAAPPDKKKKCRQRENGLDAVAIVDKLRTAGLLQYIEPTSIEVSVHTNSRKHDKREGITFKIIDRVGFVSAIKNPNFVYGTIFNSSKEHVDQVGPGAEDYRSNIGTLNTLGPDEVGSNEGIERSLEVDVSVAQSIDPNTGKQVAYGYADLDCANPAQDFKSLFEHLLGRK